jgi:extracellular factor (EF) 3-hydroxypalmitic acid methyl ester biosynthesis protein
MVNLNSICYKVNHYYILEEDDAMQDEVTYREDGVREHAGPDVDKRIQYLQFELEEATEQFNKDLEEIERKYYDPKENHDELLKATTKAMHAMSYVFEAFETEVKDKETVREEQGLLRERTHKIFQKSYFMNRARTWPQGYPGDYLTLEGVYRNTPMSEGIGHCLDNHFLSSVLGTAVRGRLATLSELLRSELFSRQQPKILSIACGSCRELFELSPEIKKSGARITCIDFDSDALAFSANRLAFAGIEPEQLVLRKYNALKMVSHERNSKEFGMQDVVYSTGFFDYLEDDTLIRLLASSYQLLNPGGTLVASFKDRRRYRHQEYHWFVDWNGFYQRTEEDMLALFQKTDIPESSLRMLRDGSGVICFFLATK